MTNLSSSRPRALRRVAPLSIVALAGILLAGCQGTAGTPGAAADVPPPGPIAAPGEVLGQGTVLQKEGEAPMLCLGPVLESYPPQCTGPEIVGWDWSTIEIAEESGGVTWGTFAVFGTWDGEVLTVTQDPVPLALFDPMAAEPDPRLDPVNAGAGDAETLSGIQADLTAAGDVDVLVSAPENGYLWVTVLYDDGSIQEYLDDIYGADLVVVVSALTDL